VAEFSATDVALNGFRVVWERPRALAFWAPFQFVCSAALSLFTAYSAGPTLTRLMVQLTQPNPDVRQLSALMAQLTPTYVILFACTLVTGAVVAAAMNRSVLRPQDGRFGYLRLSDDELRQLGLFGVMWGAVVLALVLFDLVLLAVGGSPTGVALAILVMIPALLCGLIYAGVRFSLASPMSFAERRIDLMGSWRLTQGRFWPLFGTYAFAYGMRLVVFMLTLAITGAVVAVVSAVTGEPASASEKLSVMTVLRPSGLVNLAITAFGTAIAWPITGTPPALIYRALTGDTTSRIFA
jgi:hypothetical protein